MSKSHKEVKMAIITISRGSYSKGKQIAEKVAKTLGYECISREVLLEASTEFNIPEVKLVRAIHDAPSILSRFAYGKEKYIAYIRAALLRHFKENNIVYCGLAGHFFVSGVSHVLKVRILADFQDRVRLEMAREGISDRQAAHILKHDDDERRKWSKHLYGIDTWDPYLYDLVIHVRKINIDHAVDIICDTAKLENFMATPESQKAIENLALAAEVRAAIVNLKPDVEVAASDGVVMIKTTINESKEGSMIRKIENMAGSVPGVNDVKIEVFPIDPID
jgi:cytidylate kinase